MAITYIAGGILGYLGGYCLYVAAIVTALGLLYGIVQYVVCGEMFDRFFPSAEGCNVVGVLAPDKKADQQIVIVGHHDSPYTLSFLNHLPQLAMVRLLLGIGFYTFMVISLLIGCIQQISSSSSIHLHLAQIWLFGVGLLFVVPLFFLNTNKPSPGAGDNLNATSMASTVLEHFFEERQAKRGLTHTRLIALSTDGEEVGQRGAIAYVRKHLNELKSVQTWVFTIDSVYKLQDLAVCTRDRNCTTGLSKRMAADLLQIAEARGFRLRKMAIPFGGGGTDAAAFAVAGIEATSIIGLPTGLFSRSQYYHTAEDTVDKIEPEAVAAVLGLAIDFIRQKDSSL